MISLFFRSGTSLAGGRESNQEKVTLGLVFPSTPSDPSAIEFAINI